MSKLRIAIGQINSIVGDYQSNSRKILAWIQAAHENHADLIVFPEMALCGYPVWDLANKEDFVRQGLKSLDSIIRFTRGKTLTVALGFLDLGNSKDGRSRNTIAWIRNGKLIHKQVKRLLPTYDVFLEELFFEAGKSSRVLPWKNLRVGLTICEDIWHDRYPVRPLEEIRQKNADLVISVSASPFYAGVREKREALVKRHTQKFGFPMLYVNLVGAQDDLIFDGQSFFVDEKGRVLFRSPAFKERLSYFDWDRKEDGRPEALPETDDTPAIYNALVLGVRDYCRKNKFPKAVIGLSGGIDSALVAAIAVDALGADAVTGITMPGNFSSEGSWKDSEDLARRLGIAFYQHPIRELYGTATRVYHEQKREDSKKVPAAGEITLAMENLQARLRGLHLMYVSNDEGMLLLSTGNKSELAMGYCTLYGDMAGGLCVLGDVFKTEVFKLARYRNTLSAVIPESILTKAPSAELRPNQKDEDSLPPYFLLDQILKLYIEENNTAAEIVKQLKTQKVSKALVRDIIRRVDLNEYKRRQSPPILRVTSKAWFGRRMPITNRFSY